jgi:DNA replication protein DnaC
MVARGVSRCVSRARGRGPPDSRRRGAHQGGSLSSHKTLDDFDFSYQRSIRKDVVAHLGTLDFVVAKDNVIFLGPPGTGKTHLAIALEIRSCQAGHRVAFATAAQ